MAKWQHANETLGLSADHGRRLLHMHRTSMVDSRATKKVIIDGEASPLSSRSRLLLIFGTVVRDTVIRSYMRSIAML